MCGSHYIFWGGEHWYGVRCLLEHERTALLIYRKHGQVNKVFQQLHNANGCLKRNTIIL